MSGPTNWQDFRDDATGAWARITPTHLVVLDARNFPARDLPLEYPLTSIGAVSHFPLPGGQCCVAAQIRGAERSPGFTFTDEALAGRFAAALGEALEALAKRCRASSPADDERRR